MSSKQKHIYDFSAEALDGNEKPLADFKGKVLLIVNTASKCGFTPQYKGLQSLYSQYHAKGFEILGFSCNQFLKQEPGTSDEIASFCEINYGVTFPLFAKVKVNGKDTHPLFTYLKQVLPGMAGSQKIKWNFTKFLLDSDGNPVRRFSPQTDPKSMIPFIEKLL